MSGAANGSFPYLNRELSWLAFNARVLEEALDERVPLLERLKFLAIFSTNLDEFYMVRVAGLRRKVAAGAKQYAPDTLSPSEQLEAIRRRVAELLARRHMALHEKLLPALERHGVRLLGMQDITEQEAESLARYFDAQVFPILTPLAVDPGHPFPYISNLSLSLAVDIRDPDTGKEHFARVKVPPSLPRWVPVRDNCFVPLEQLIGANLGALFPGMEVQRWFGFRITRYSDLDLGQMDQPEDLLETIEQQIFQRRFGEVVRLEVQREMPTAMRQLLLEELSESESQEVAPLQQDDVHEIDDLLELGNLISLASLDIPALRDSLFAPLPPAAFRDGRNIFDVIRERDVLVHHPFESFAGSVEAFLEAAANDVNVLAMKLTLYRTSGDIAIVRALEVAAQAGKQVAVLIELQARFDEQNNITFARTMENLGIHVAYGLPGLKTHAKTALVVRRDADGIIRRYVHISTGNYNSKTAKLYTDIGLFTCNPEIGADLSDLFNSLTGVARQRKYRKLHVAPINLRKRTLELIEREGAHARAGGKGRIIAKLNALVDPDVISALYRASQDGVEIDLIVRGICCLVPGLPGISERIRVVSIIGRFLEHSRILYFGNADAPEYYIGSADWMPRNLDRRVEVMVPVEDKQLHEKLYALLQTCLRDNRQAWSLGADGTYRRRAPQADAEYATHETLMKEPWGLSPDQRSTPRRKHKARAKERFGG